MRCVFCEKVLLQFGPVQMYFLGFDGLFLIESEAHDGGPGGLNGSCLGEGEGVNICCGSSFTLTLSNWIALISWSTLVSNSIFSFGFWLTVMVLELSISLGMIGGLDCSAEFRRGFLDCTIVC